MQAGDKVLYSGYEGTITEIHAWSDNQLCDVRLPGGLACVSLSELSEVKTPGQKAYEEELSYCPNYHDGAPRKQWNELKDYQKKTWEDNPTPRKMRKVFPI